MNAAEIERVAVVGLGTMGHGIAQTFAVAGYKVSCFDEDSSARDSLVDRVSANLSAMAQAGVVDGESLSTVLDRLVICTDLADAVAAAAFVTEAVREDLPVKQRLFSELEAHVTVDTILASNSSSYPISQTAKLMRRPERAIVTHWFNPPHIVPVVEVVPGEKTIDSATTTACDLLRRIGKRPVRLNKEIPGFLVNRVQIAMYREIWDLLDRGIASAEEIDAAICGSMGFRLAAIGPLAVNDFAGLDITARVFENLAPDLRSDGEVPGVIQQLVEQGRFGTKTGRGIFAYTPELIERLQAARDRRYLRLLSLLRGDD